MLAVGKCASSAGRIVTDGIGWNPSSEAGKAGEPVQKYTFEEEKSHSSKQRDRMDGNFRTENRNSENENQLTKSCRSTLLIFSTMLQSQRLNFSNLSPLSLDSSLNVVYEINVPTWISPTPFSNNRRSSPVKDSNAPLGSTSNTPRRNAWWKEFGF